MHDDQASQMAQDRRKLFKGLACAALASAPLWALVAFLWSI